MTWPLFLLSDCSRPEALPAYSANVGEPLYGTGTYNEFVAALEEAMTKLGDEENKPAWD